MAKYGPGDLVRCTHSEQPELVGAVGSVKAYYGGTMKVDFPGLGEKTVYIECTVPADGHAEYLKILDEMAELHCRKAADYGRGADPFANVRAGAEFGVPPWVGVMIRANDKLHRIKSFVANGELKNESVEDSLKDLAAYALIALVLFREDQAKKGGGQ